MWTISPIAQRDAQQQAPKVVKVKSKQAWKKLRFTQKQLICLNRNEKLQKKWSKMAKVIATTFQGILEKGGKMPLIDQKNVVNNCQSRKICFRCFLAPQWAQMLRACSLTSSSSLSLSRPPGGERKRSHLLSLPPPPPAPARLPRSSFHPATIDPRPLHCKVTP